MSEIFYIILVSGYWNWWIIRNVRCWSSGSLGFFGSNQCGW